MCNAQLVESQADKKVEVKEQYKVKMSNRFAALDSLYVKGNIYMELEQ
jgi:hypothetical protein